MNINILIYFTGTGHRSRMVLIFPQLADIFPKALYNFATIYKLT